MKDYQKRTLQYLTNGLKFEEIAEKEGITYDGVEMRVRRLRRQYKCKTTYELINKLRYEISAPSNV